MKKNFSQALSKQKVFVLKNLLCVIILTLLCMTGWWCYKYYMCPSPSTTYNGQDYQSYLEQCAVEAKSYIDVRGLNSDYCVFVDYGIPSGTPRVFVWSFQEEKVIAQTYSMHGPGNGSTAEKPVFSNMAGSKCSTLGHFAITKNHGKKQKRGFRLNGLDVSNRNAYNRGIMLHRAKWVDTHCWMDYIPLNEISCQGCVTVSTRGFNYLEKLIKEQEKQILLWSIDSTQS